MKGYQTGTHIICCHNHDLLFTSHVCFYFSSYCSENKVATLMILPLYIVASNYTVLSLKLAIFHQTRLYNYHYSTKLYRKIT